MMTGSDVLIVLQALQRQGVDVCVDGGWAVDALLGAQTRQHDDLDIAVPHGHVPRLRATLTRLGFVERLRPDLAPHNFVLATPDGQAVDVHSYILASDGRNVGGIGYAAEDFNGEGIIDGFIVRCIGPESLIRFHTGYQPDENDRHDVRLLCQRFGLTPPSGFVGPTP
jgi:lincosamide nucleotidyltransferase A/C/D/E